MRTIRKIYNLYRERVADILFIAVIVVAVYFFQYVPYVNIFIVSVDPLYTGVMVAWIVFYIIMSPLVSNASRIIIWSFVIFLVAFPFISLFHKTTFAELLASLTYIMILTVVIVEVVKLKGKG